MKSKMGNTFRTVFAHVVLIFLSFLCLFFLIAGICFFSLRGEVSVLCNQFADSFPHYFPRQKHIYIWINNTAFPKTNPFCIVILITVVCTRQSMGFSTRPILLFQKCDCLFGIVSLTEIFINTERTMLKTAPSAKPTVNLIHCNKIFQSDIHSVTFGSWKSTFLQ